MMKQLDTYADALRQSGSDFRVGTTLRTITFPQLGGFKIGSNKDFQTRMPALVTGWPVVQRNMCFQSLN